MRMGTNGLNHAVFREKNNKRTTPSSGNDMQLHIICYFIKVIIVRQIDARK